MQKFNGIVKWFNDDKGFGFIKGEDNKDIFVHYSTIREDGHKTLKNGEYVEFEAVNTEKGLQAKNVVKKEKTMV